MSTLTVQNPFYLALIFAGFWPKTANGKTAKRSKNRKPSKPAKTENAATPGREYQLYTQITVVSFCNFLRGQISIVFLHMIH